MTAVDSFPKNDRSAGPPPAPPVLPASRQRYHDLACAVVASLVAAVLVAIPVAIAIVETAHG